MNTTHRKGAAFILLLVMLLLFAGAALAQTSVRGVIAGDTKWTANRSPYLISGDVTVAHGVSLTIGRNVTVHFSSGSQLTIKGTLDAYRAFFDGFFEKNNQERLHFQPQSRGRLVRCAFLDLSLVADTSALQLSSCVVTNRNGTGVTIGATASPHIIETSFHGNSYFAVYHEGESPLAITRCFWGAATGPCIRGKGQGDAVSTNIVSDPFYSEAPVSFLFLIDVAVRVKDGVSDKALELTYHVYNMDQGNRKAVLGASLHGLGDTVYHHPESDIRVSIPFGYHTYTRTFAVSHLVREGTYDVHASVMTPGMSEYYGYVRCSAQVKILSGRLCLTDRLLSAADTGG